MRRVLLAALLLSACTTKRTEIVIGVATNLDAPTPLSSVHATVSREGVPLLQQDWMLPGVPQGQFELPGSLGVYTDDGTEPRIEIELVAFSTTGDDIIHRRSILSLVKEQTLFLRMTLTDGCIHRSDCSDSQTCIEGHCVPVDIDAHILPPYVDKMELSVSCQTGIHYRDTGTKMDMPMLGPGCGAGETCSEGTCLKMPSSGGDGGVTTDGGGPLPDGSVGGPVRFAYVANAANAEIRNFTVDSMGTLTTLFTAPTVTVPGTPGQVMVDPSNNFLLVTVTDLSEVASYAINQSTGVPSMIGTAAAGNTPVSLAIHPAGFVYVANLNSNNVSLLTLNGSTGALTFVGNQAAGGTSVAWVAMDPMGKNLYVTGSASDTLTVFSINSQTGALTQLGTPVTTGIAPVQVLVDPAGAFVHCANSGGGSVSHFTRDPSTGALTPLTGMDAASGMTPRSLVITPDGRFAYVGNSTGGNITIFQISGSTWTATGAPFTINGQPQFVTLNPAGNVLYAVNQTPGTVLPMQITTTTGALSALQGIATGTSPVSISFAH